MEDENLDFKDYCEECGKKTRKRFIERKDEYMIYECSLCGNNEEIPREEVEEKTEEWK